MGHVEIGTAESSPGTTTTGWVDVTELRPELGSPHIIEEQYLDAAITGIHSHRVDRGQVVEPGDPIADITTPHGAVKGTVETNEQGYILGRRQGVGTYENDILVSMTAPDDGDLLVERTCAAGH